MPIYSSDSDNNQPSRSVTFSGRRRPLHKTLGGGKVADVLLWKNKRVSGGLLMGATVIWFLFEVAEYHVVTLLCHIILAAMSFVFIWSNLAPLVQRDPPTVYIFQLSDSTCKYVFAEINRFLLKVYDISCGKDRKLFFAAIGSLWILSVVGNYVNSLNLLYFAFICVETLPALYERYEREVDYIAGKGRQDAKKMYHKFEAEVLNMIPRGPIKEKKFK
ncbi:reticulon-like protein B14 [Punica granatum]|uniref:Reticulon-like protein n=2 Tax=Punica granatum TaxID=22663 RepID=A0A218WKK7_PUNGR|nr:reticulon-like protein B14 [Punica granatum]OWM72900.1 hypothetical protein CDL15_Pgr016532 [Punica granatum]PKI49686.1 hypothetical protein CRG98_029931 [Punica granatum]